MPAGARTPAPRTSAPRPSAPRTSAAPFRAVPSPEPREEVAARRGVDAFARVPVPAVVGGPTGRPARPGPAAPALPRPSRQWTDDDSAAATGPGAPGGLRTSGPAPRLPRQTTTDGAASPAYGDWTKPSRSGDGARTAPGTDAAQPVRIRQAPGTTAIPERPVAGRRERPADDLDGAPARPAAGVSGGPGTGPVVGGRAAMRAERQAADMARRKAAKRSGVPAVAVLDEDDEKPTRKPRRVATGLLAMAVVALGVLGVYSFVSPGTDEAGAQNPITPSSTPIVATEAAPLPTVPTEPVMVESPPAAPVRVPVTVLNSTDINGLAKKVSDAVVAAGWESPGVGAYEADDVAASTVFFTEGDEMQRQAAVQLVDQFPQLQGPAPRFFELPAGVTAPGLVVVVTGDWQP